MDQRTLVVSCVEYYSDLKAIPSDKVFAAFEKAGFIKMILESQQMFPEMGVDFYIGMVDGLTHLESDSSVGENTHHEERTALATEVVAMLMKKLVSTKNPHRKFTIPLKPNKKIKGDGRPHRPSFCLH